ncbi:MAG: DMT family transporter [Anaerovorax sp.]|nr:DMT family transporter [Anaerovorax sp.]
MKKGYLYIAFATFLFSTMEIALKSIAGQFHPIQLTLTRFFIGGIFLLPFALSAMKKKQAILDKQSIQYFALLGLIGVVISMTFYQLAVENAKASVVAVLFSSNPVFVMLLAYFILHEFIYKRNLVSLFLEVLGILIIINPLHTEISAAGISFTLLATVTFSLYGVLGKKKCQEYGGVVVTCFSFILGSLEMLLFIMLSHIKAISLYLTSIGFSVFSEIPLFSGYTANNFLTVLYIAIGVTGGGYAFYFLAMEATSANTASLTFFFKPVLAPMLAAIFLKEIIPFSMIIGITLILFGSMVSLYPNFVTSKSISNQENQNP